LNVLFLSNVQKVDANSAVLALASAAFKLLIQIKKIAFVQVGTLLALLGTEACAAPQMKALQDDEKHPADRCRPRSNL